MALDDSDIERLRKAVSTAAGNRLDGFHAELRFEVRDEMRTEIHPLRQEMRSEFAEQVRRLEEFYTKKAA